MKFAAGCVVQILTSVLSDPVLEVHVSTLLAVFGVIVHPTPSKMLVEGSALVR